MIDEKINKTLLELEKTLRDIQSARNHVDKMVKAYGDLNDKTTEYVNCLPAISEELSKLVNLVGEDYGSKVKEFETDRMEISNSCNAVIAEAEKAAEDVKNAVLTNVDNINKKFKYVLSINVVSTLILIALFVVTYLSK